MSAVRTWRKNAKLSQKRLSGRLRVTQGMYSRYERGIVPWPTRIAWRLVVISLGALSLEDLYPKDLALKRKRPLASQRAAG